MSPEAEVRSWKDLKEQEKRGGWSFSFVELRDLHVPWLLPFTVACALELRVGVQGSQT